MSYIDKEFVARELDTLAILINLSEENREEVRDWMKKTKTRFRYVETYCSQAGWKGFDLYPKSLNPLMPQHNLSVNGFCYSEQRLMNFIRAYE